MSQMGYRKIRVTMEVSMALWYMLYNYGCFMIIIQLWLLVHFDSLV